MSDSVLLRRVRNTFRNLPTSALYEHVLRRGEAQIAHRGPLIVHTGARTGRSPKDKFIAMEPSCADKVWWGDVNQPILAERFDAILHRVEGYLQGRDVYVQDCYVGADPEHRLPIQVITETAWQNLFARNLFLRRTAGEKGEFTIISLPNFHAIPEIDGTHSEAFVLINFARRIVMIGGTAYAGEIKKSAFTLMNYLLPDRNVMPMHCSANIGSDGATAILFGLSGTGKTTLSADPDRRLIGDDEHGWSENGVFNFEGGCYAKVIRLSKEAEPDIYAATRRFGTIIENVVIDEETRRLRLDDASITENTRAAYPINYIGNVERSGLGGHPNHIIMLTADAFGVLPPISKLSPEQAMYHFVSGYTAKVAGTESGLGKEPQATFSTCFGAPFMARHPTVYANLLRERIEKHQTQCWLVNTGWTGGAYGTGTRMKIAHTRAMVRAALEGRLADVETREDPLFKVRVPTHCPEVPDTVLDPRNTWRDPAAYDLQARDLANRFQANFETFASDMTEEVVAAGPR
jgi:phosphoenolpyruvate carboxykinase (ATP)